MACRRFLLVSIIPVIGLVATAPANPARAAEVPNAGTVLGTVQDAERRSESKPAPELNVERESRGALEAPSGVRFKLTGLRITGTAAYPESTLLPLVRGYVG